MYESVTREAILKRMSDRAETIAQTQGYTLDRRVASMIFFALAPAAQELRQMYIELDQVLNESFADTESRSFLIRRCRERGLFPNPATCREESAALREYIHQDREIDAREKEIADLRLKLADEKTGLAEQTAILHKERADTYETLYRAVTRKPSFGCRIARAVTLGMYRCR